MEFEPVIGLEVHVQLSTLSKLFCGCSTAFGAPPNTQVCPVCLGYPGALPVPNRQALAFGLRLALALGAGVARETKFDRKNYFYPDLPKGYQISQHDIPLCTGGSVTFDLDDGTEREVRLIRIHLEEDAGKSIHDAASGTSFIDLNRCGTPLLEMVSHPEIRSGREAYHYLRALRDLVRWLAISDGNMDEGSLRCDVNISVRPRGASTLGTRAEVKNLNSFANVEQAIESEHARQAKVLNEGGVVRQETRTFDAERGVTAALRAKEEAHDYRYFPEPDLWPLAIGEELIEAERRALPELPGARRRRYRERLGLSAYDARLLASAREHSDYFDAMVAAGIPAKSACNWFQSEILRELNERKIGIESLPIAAAQLAPLLAAVDAERISVAAGRELFRKAVATGTEPARLLGELSAQVSDESIIAEWVDRALAEDAGAVEKVKSGNERPLARIVGRVMALSSGKANPRRVMEIVRKKILGTR